MITFVQMMFTWIVIGMCNKYPVWRDCALFLPSRKPRDGFVARHGFDRHNHNTTSQILELHELTVHEDDLHPASPFVGLSVRVWRILRIVHAFTVALELEYQEAQNCELMEDKLQAMMQTVSNLESELYHEKRARAALEKELARLNRVKRSYDALGVRVPL